MENEKRTDDREQDLPEINDPRVVEVWEEACDGRKVLMRNNGSIEFKPCGLEGIAKSVSYYEFFPELMAKNHVPKTTEELDKDYSDEILSRMDYHLLEIKKNMETAYKHLFIIEELSKNGGLKPIDEESIDLAEEGIRDADFNIWVLEQYIHKFPWLEPEISPEIDTLKKKVKEEQLKVRQLRLDLMKKA